jgi:hypothetical protein
MIIIVIIVQFYSKLKRKKEPKSYCPISDVMNIQETFLELNERKTNLMQLLYIFIVAVGDALHVSGLFAQHQERQKTARAVTPAASTRFAPVPPAQSPQHTAQNTYATDLVF